MIDDRQDRAPRMERTTEAPWSDHRVEQIIGRLLQFGVLAAAAVVILGGVPLLLIHGRDVANFSVFRSAPSALRTVGGIVHAAFALDPRAVVQLGLVLLIATPVARVALTLVAFVLQRDRLYVAITTLVLVLLLYGLI
jgi:uncharacterized membrane protein